MRRHLNLSCLCYMRVGYGLHRFQSYKCGQLRRKTGIAEQRKYRWRSARHGTSGVVVPSLSFPCGRLYRDSGPWRLPRWPSWPLPWSTEPHSSGSDPADNKNPNTSLFLIIVWLTGVPARPMGAPVTVQAFGHKPKYTTNENADDDSGWSQRIKLRQLTPWGARVFTCWLGHWREPYLGPERFYQSSTFSITSRFSVKM